MTRSKIVVLVAVLLSVGCAELEKEKLPQITTEGPHSVTVGGTITIVPVTTNGTDSAYSFMPGSTAIATVDALGVITGVAPGETSITVRGASTGASASHAVVVLPATGGPGLQIPNYAAWLGSAHADTTAVAFNNWNEAGEVPTTCARCHSSEGFVDYLGGDGSVPGRGRSCRRRRSRSSAARPATPPRPRS